MKLRDVILFFLLFITLSATSIGTTIKSDFSCVSHDNQSTMTYYSYLKEPIVEKSGYTRGYKAGSLSYLENGSINFKDTTEYYDGQVDSEHLEGDDHNSTVYINQTVEFQGTKSISEFYAKGFYPSNRALSAWKKIRYDDVSYEPDPSGIINLSKSYTCLEKRYMSNKLNIKVDVGMGPQRRRNNDYDFQYTANVTNGIIEIKDATGWTNETVSDRIDWERDSLIRGNITVRNDLKAKSLFFPAAGGNDDWLPCCFNGSQPPIVNRFNPAMLKPDGLLPTRKLNKTETIEEPEEGEPGSPAALGKYGPAYSIKSKRFNVSERSSSKLENLTCYECIYTQQEGESLGHATTAVPTVQVDKIYVRKSIVYENESLIPLTEPVEVNEGERVWYEILVFHNSPYTLKNVTITDELPANLSYTMNRDSSWVYYMNEGTGESKEESIVPVQPIDEKKPTWNISVIDPSVKVFLYITATATVDGTDAYGNKAYAEGTFEYETQDIRVASNETTVLREEDGRAT